MKKKKIIQELFFIIIIMLFFCLKYIVKQVNDLDELWNYNFARGIANGLMPYRDFNIIITPMLPTVCGLIMRIFGQELYIMRVLAIILNTALIYIIYKIQQNLKINKAIILGTIVLIFYLLGKLFAIDYNFAITLNTLIILYLELKSNKETPKLDLKYDFLIGILLGIGITIKQTVGIVVMLAFSGYFIVFNIKNKESYKKFFIRILGAMIPCAIMIIILLINGALYDFFDYCILGIKTFSNKISYIELIKGKNILIKILSILMPLIILINAFLGIIKKDNNCRILFAAEISLMILTFPISDRIHFSISIIPSIIGLAYLFNMLIIKINCKKNSFIVTFVATACTLTLFVCLGLQYITAFKQTKQINVNKEINNYKYLNLDKASIEDIKLIDNYILSQEKKVYILDPSAVYYMIPINRYNKDYDLFLIGNLGGRGEQGQIQKIKNETNVIYLIKNEKHRRNWQNPEKVRKFVIENLNKIGEIGVFDIYEK